MVPRYSSADAAPCATMPPIASATPSAIRSVRMSDSFASLSNSVQSMRRGEVLDQKKIFDLADLLQRSNQPRACDRHELAKRRRVLIGDEAARRFEGLEHVGTHHH